MAYSFNEFMNQVRLDNQNYERVYDKIGLAKSRLHDFVEWLSQNPNPSSADLYAKMSSVPGNAWDTKYHHAKRYLVREFRLVREFDMPGAEVPAGQAPVLARAVRHSNIDVIGVGYGLHGGHAAATAGIQSRPDGRFYWAIEVVYTLHPSIDTSMYAPFRKVKDAQSYIGLGNLIDKPEAQLKSEVGARTNLNPDGPRYYNVVREPHTIRIYDGPGIDAPAAAMFITNDPGSYPIRHCAFFEMSLYLVKPGKDLQGDFDQPDHSASLGSELAGSRVAFHYVMSRIGPHPTVATGNFTIDH